MILSVPDQSQLLIRPYYNFFLPIEIPKKTPLPKTQKEKPNILHAVALRTVKGTDTLIEKIKNIKSKYGDIFDFVCVEDRKPEEVKILLQEADIVTYCLIGQGPGMFGLEAMLNKTLLMTGNDEQYLKYPTADMVVDTDFDNLEEKLLFYIQNPQKRIEMIEIAYQNVCKHNDMYVVCENIIKQLYNPQEKHIFLHFPTYFSQFAKLDSKYDLLDKNIINQWTNYIKNCEWYNESLKVKKLKKKSTTRKMFNEISFFETIEKNINIFSKRFLRFLAMYYPNSKVRRECWKKTNVILGENTYLNPNITVVDDYQSDEILLELGDNCSVAPGVVFAPHSDHNNSSFLKTSGILDKYSKKEKITIGNDVWIGANCTILAGVKIGNHCIIGANSLVSKDIPNFSLAYGVPCKVIKKLDAEN